MKFAENRPVKIVMLGAGGTGGHIAPHLYRLLYALERPVRFIICDGDIVEEKNLVRQNFTPADLGENKAKVLSWSISTTPTSTIMKRLISIHRNMNVMDKSIAS